MPIPRWLTDIAQHCKAPRILAIGHPRNCNNKCVSGGQRLEQTAAIKLNILQCCAISDWHSSDSNPKICVWAQTKNHSYHFQTQWCQLNQYVQETLNLWWPEDIEFIDIYLFHNLLWSDLSYWLRLMGRQHLLSAWKRWSIIDELGRTIV